MSSANQWRNESSWRKRMAKEKLALGVMCEMARNGISGPRKPESIGAAALA
jgi:hypothetical protein